MPVALVSNWTIQAKKFFPDKELSVKVWSPAAWDADAGKQGTVWIVKESYLSQIYARSSPVGPQRKTPFWEIFSDPNVSANVQLLSTFGDEGHLAWRSDDSIRSMVYKTVTSLSQFNVILSGTMFPLAPEEDARGILEHMGGSLSAEAATVKWRTPLLTGFQRLLGIRPADQKEYRWDVLAFRILISPFYIRRSVNSCWEGQWIVGKAAYRPVPRIVLPNPDSFTNLDDPRAKSKEITQTRETLRNKMKRADQKRFLAWTQVYEKIKDEQGDTAFTGAAHIRTLERYIEQYVRRQRGSGRVTKLIALIKGHVEKGEKFVLVSDRLFLVLLAYHVLTSSLF